MALSVIDILDSGGYTVQPVPGPLSRLMLMIMLIIMMVLIIRMICYLI